jgi:predicted ATPase
LRPNASVLSTLAQVRHPLASRLVSAAAYLYSNIGPVYKIDTNDEMAIPYYQADSALLERLNREISRLDVGIQSVDIAQGPSGLSVQYNHEGLSTPIPSVLESNGTRNFFHVFPIISGALQNGGVAIVDEFDAALHPLLLPEIVRWFYDPERNQLGAQLWVTCHAASLLEELVKEEVFFCEKDLNGRTAVFGLRDVQGVRRVDNYYKKYLGGVYGAVPRIG